MSSKIRRRVAMAAGASIAGAAIPIAAACTAWADDVDISYDGKVIFDDFDSSHPFGSSDVGTEAVSGLNGDYAEVVGPASDSSFVGPTALASDNATGDSNDVAFYDSATAPSAFYGDEGATIINATNSYAEVFGGGNADINPINYGPNPDAVTDSTAIASNGGTALVSNDGNFAPLTTTAMTGDYAFANGTANDTTTVAGIFDSNNSVSIANDTGFSPTTFEGGSAIDEANNSFAYAVHAGSAANVEGGPLGGDTGAIANDTNLVGDGNVFTETGSNLFQIDGIPDATFYADLFGVNGFAAETTAFTDLLQLFSF